VDKSKLVGILRFYSPPLTEQAIENIAASPDPMSNVIRASPPLSTSQVDAIAKEIAELSIKERKVAKKRAVPKKAIPIPQSVRSKKSGK